MPGPDQHSIVMATATTTTPPKDTPPGSISCSSKPLARPRRLSAAPRELDASTSPIRRSCSHPPPAYRRSRPTPRRLLRPRPRPRPRPSPPFERFAGQQRRSTRRRKAIPRRNQHAEQAGHSVWSVGAHIWVALRRVGPSLQRCDLPWVCCTTTPLPHQKVTEMTWPCVGCLGMAWDQQIFAEKKTPTEAVLGVCHHVAGTLGSSSRTPPVAFSPARVAVLQEVEQSCLAAQSPRRSSAPPPLCVKACQTLPGQASSPLPGQRAAQESTSVLQARLADWGGEGGVFALGSGVAKIDGYAPERVDLARQDGQCWLLVGQRCGRQEARLTDGRQHCEGEVRFGEGASEPSTSSQHGSGGRHAGIRQPGDDLPAMPPPAQSP